MNKRRTIYFLIISSSLGKYIIRHVQVAYEIIPIRYLCQNQIWFILGMLWNYMQIRIKNIMFFASILFCVLSVYDFFGGIYNVKTVYLLTFWG